MAFDNVVFPLMIESCSSSPEFSTTIIALGDGREQRIGNWDEARVTFNAAMGVRSLADVNTLVDFFRARKGRLRGFLVKDLIDYKVEKTPFYTGNGTNKVVRLPKVYGNYDTNIDARWITKPVLDTVKIYSNDVLMSPSAYSINPDNGVTTFVTAPAVGVTIAWEGEFYVPCRFLEDRLPIEDIVFDMVSNRGAGNIPSVPMIEIRDVQ